MASLYKRGNVWWLKWSNEHGEVCRETTGLKVNDRSDTREARQVLRLKTLEEEELRKERRASGLAKGGEGGGDGRRRVSRWQERMWDQWVDGYLDLRHRESPKTLERYRAAWATVRWWLMREGIRQPSEVTRETAHRFATWRGGDKPQIVGKSPTHPEVHKAAPTTVVLEVKVWAGIMDEAVERGFVARNPCRRLGLSRKPLRRKPEITVEEEKKIREALATKPEWMRVSFNLAMAQGVRLSETEVDLQEDVDWKREVVTIHGKGGRTYSTRINPDVMPMLRALRERGCRHACKLGRHASRDWLRFFDLNELKHLSFHCTRVTAITRAARAGVPRAQALRFFNHASNAVHDIYTRLEVDDTDEAVAALRSECEVKW